MIEFSVALHTYNRPEYICETIDAVLNQTVKAKEVIVIDDGSTDNSEELLSKYGRAIKYIKINNVGAGNSRKRAIEECKYEWIACSDDDDVWLPEHLETLTKTILAIPQSVLVFSNYTHIGAAAKPNYNHFLTGGTKWWNKTTTRKIDNTIQLRSDSFLDLLLFNPASASNWVLNRNAYYKIGGANESYSRLNSEDADITRRMSLLGPICANTNITVQIRKHETNMSISFAKNLLGKAKMLSDYVENKVIPKKYEFATLQIHDKCIIDAFKAAYWDKDFEFALSIYSNSNSNIFTLKNKIIKNYCLLAVFVGSRRRL